MSKTLFTLALLLLMLPLITVAQKEKGKKKAGEKGKKTEKVELTAPSGVIIFEAESTKSELDKWVLITKKDSNYVNDAKGNKHLEFTGNTMNGGSATSPLEYTFTVPSDGTYRLLIRCRKRLAGEPGDKCNDGWVKVEGSFESGNEIPAEDLKKNEKFFGGAADSWGWAETLDWQGHIKREALYKFKKGETYKLVVSGRSIRWNIDCISFYDTEKFKLQDVKKLIDPNFKIDEISTNWNMTVDGYTPCYFDGGNKAFAINTIAESKEKWAAATKEFKGEAGKYTINFTSLLEQDGECSYKVFVDGKEIMSFTNPRIHGTDKKDYTPNKVSAKDIDLKKGSIVKVEFLPNSNKLVPEGTGFAYARARWRDVEFVKQ